MSIIFRNCREISRIKFSSKIDNKVKRIVLDQFTSPLIGTDPYAAFSDFKLITNSNGDLFDTGNLIYVSTRGGADYPNPRLETTTLTVHGSFIYPHPSHYRFDYAFETAKFNPPNTPEYRYIILGTPVAPRTNFTDSVIDITYNEPTDAYGFKLKPYVDSRGRRISGLRYSLYNNGGTLLEQKSVTFASTTVGAFIPQPIVFDIGI